MSARKEPYSVEASQRRTRISLNVKGPHSAAFFAKRNMLPKRIMKPSHPNKILRLTILEMEYEINTETLNYFFSQYGNVLRIVIFGKGGLPGAMVEYDSIEGLNKFSLVLRKFI